MANIAEEQTTRLRELLTAAGGANKGRGRGYGTEARAEAVAYARRRLSKGASLHTIAGDIGLSSTTLSYWLKRRGRGGFARVTIAPDAIAPDSMAPDSPAPDDQPSRPIPSTWPRTPPILLISPTGWRVEGLDLASLAALLRGHR